ncbi:MAG: DNA protecting protein DprA [Candidatus Yanofskybacteria bacterium RIFCSPHIGHO2_02_FULL_38_22b]|uniref:DNA protecting protein DprA n=1 Tax=Candidatus Yanofskybacteria bacterium RIFCSPHIGHO2_02_FULL_38_22b TaxID=1802673 RepID=A0A1F8EZ91_9BACT|nr:MAG: DNA protecting protein DprA [Candidatus Yanofskybacteria bacterium RIFCSPHIGHO2_01_FULL_39_44]OGN06191.1 MAG: DNA protecting protein DprA [Candidatus Yanofskybacteria bacterium RIFCSPHIGHO2_02_FULL_38_22b]OGN19611.1 MAG: DNA protecting protein DprA [Candidatus Yanofskybacteria bacterium RIFCSPLOWO2_01_FULL_39_28]
MNFPIIEIKIKTKEYPKLLAQIHNPPKQLYCRGNIELLKSFCIGVVGTRKLTAYGKEATERIVSELTGNDITIVSGLAMGVDAIAHQTALDNELPTIAVLGSGVDNNCIYPRVNFNLAREILSNNGLIVSEYKPGFQANEKTFPQRNRIISGLSKGVLVVEAPLISGALITTRFATEQNRDVFAVPGNIFSPNSKGPNMLIGKGAKPVFSAQDIIDSYYQNMGLDLEPKNKLSTKNPIEKQILGILDENGELSGDDIISLTNLETSQVIAALSMLELKNKVKLKASKYTVAKR